MIRSGICAGRGTRGHEVLNNPPPMLSAPISSFIVSFVCVRSGVFPQGSAEESRKDSSRLGKLPRASGSPRVGTSGKPLRVLGKP